MKLEQLNSVEDIRRFLDGTDIVAFNVVTTKQERYQWVLKALKKHRYRKLRKLDKGTMTQYLMKVTGYSKAQIKRLIQQFVKTSDIKIKTTRRNGFTCRYTPSDIRLLAEMDERHQQPSGAVIKKLCERAYLQFGQDQYQNLANISVSHLYNLRRSKTYQRQRCSLTKTQPKKVAIGIRRKPCPNDQPGYIRIDSVHQGDQDKRKGLYHINAVDAVTQFQVIVTVERISEAFMLPAIQQLLNSFPFKIQGFHADNGGEYINYTIAALLDKLLIEFTKSRPRHSNDNALVESKNGSVVRKLYGYEHIPQHHASQFSAFNQMEVYRYVNFHRPCYFPTTVIDNKGKERKKYAYSDMMTPYDKLVSLPNPKQYLKPDITLEQLYAFSKEMNDNEAAEQLNTARDTLFRQLHERHDLRA